jgi:hypothetical protein
MAAKVQQVRANFEFHAENDAELSFRVGDVITVLNQDDPGWWEGELNGHRGLFPANYVDPIKSGAPPRQVVPPPPIAAPQKYFPNEGGATPGAPAQAQYQVAQYQVNNPGAPRPYQDQAQNYTALKDVVPAAAPTKTEQKTDTGFTPAGKVTDHTVDVSPAQFRAAVKIAASKTKFGVFAAALAWWSAWTAVGIGACTIVWGLVGAPRYGLMEVNTGAYSAGVGFGTLLYEQYWGQRRGSSRIPVRALVYWGLSVFMFFSLGTLVVGVFYVVTGLFNLVSTMLGEVYDAPPHNHQAQVQVPSGGFCESLFGWLMEIKEQNRIGVLVFVFTYFACNVILFFKILNDWININISLGPLQLSGWAAYAKAFGWLLDLNASIILLPVCRTIIRWMYNRSTADQSFVARTFRAILYFIPIDRNLTFHKLIAKVVMFAAIGHTLAHFINYPLAATNAIAIFKPWSFFTGGVIMLTMLFIYSGAAEGVRRGQFEIFWYSHHVFVLFFGFNLVHSRGFFNPDYILFFPEVGFLYLIERIARLIRANKKVVILSVTIMDDVLSLEVAKEGVFAQPYKEGQYIFLNSPPISRIQWHPFTISSAPEEQSVTVHIRVQGDGSWTRGLRDFVSAMGPRGRPFFKLDRQGPNGKVDGKILGPDGQPILQIDGPHSAPTQHIGEYSNVMIVGAGIGVTPVASTIKSVVFHKWKYFIGQCFPDHAYFVWVCAHRDIDAFRWLIRVIKDAQDEVCHMRATNPAHMAAKSFEVHIYVSSVPKGQKPVDVVVDDEVGFWGVPREDAKVEKVRCNWDEADLYKTMLCPTAHTQLTDVHVWEGRPKWDQRFSSISKAHPDQDIGVMFCGNPAIAKDLRKYCHIHSRGRTKGIFKLHKENF